MRRRRNDDAENLLLPYYRSFYVCIQEAWKWYFEAEKERKKRESVCTIHTCVPSGTDGYIHMYVAGLIRMYAHYSMYVQLPFEKLYKYIYRYLTKYVFAQWLLKERKKRKKKHESPALPKR